MKLKDKEEDKKKIVISMGRRIYRLILFVFIVLGGALTIFAVAELFIGTIGYLRTRALYREANNRFVSVHARKEASDSKAVPEPASVEVTVSEDTVSENEAEEEDETNSIEVDIAALKEINDEVIGWLYFEDGLISYPVLFSGDNDKYLKRNYKEEYMASGSIFMDKDGTPDFSDHYTLLYGHNMRDLTMFGKLRYYRSDKNYYKDHEYFQIITEDGVYRYRVFSFKQISSDSDVFSAIHKDEDGLKSFAEKYLLPGNNVNTKAEISDSDHVLALSTCVNDYAYRFIVCGVRVDSEAVSGNTVKHEELKVSENSADTTEKKRTDSSSGQTSEENITVPIPEQASEEATAAPVENGPTVIDVDI